MDYYCWKFCILLWKFYNSRWR